MKTASILGASGATGQELLQLLLASSHYSKVKSFGRRQLDIQHNKLEQYQINFADMSNMKEQIQADDVFVCIGTTQKKAGSKEKFRSIDYDIPVQLSQIIDKDHIQNFIIMSSIGASSASMSFYLKTKGEMEEVILKEFGEKAKILRPSLLLGKRDDFRIIEELRKFFYIAFSPFMIGKLNKYKAIQTKDVAKAMIRIANKTTNISIFESNIIAKTAKESTLN